jgi:dynein heavy chain
MLCLSNGQRIKLNPSIHLLFEVEDLSVASPATISRCGMVCILLLYYIIIYLFKKLIV